jgi:hypothetical protein
MAEEITPFAVTITISTGTAAPTVPAGSVRVGSAGVDAGGNIWLFFPRTTISGTTSGGWMYAATVTGGLPAGATVPIQETP